MQVRTNRTTVMRNLSLGALYGFLNIALTMFVSYVEGRTGNGILFKDFLKNNVDRCSLRRLHLGEGRYNEDEGNGMSNLLEN